MCPAEIEHDPADAPDHLCEQAAKEFCSAGYPHRGAPSRNSQVLRIELYCASFNDTFMRITVNRQARCGVQASRPPGQSPAGASVRVLRGRVGCGPRSRFVCVFGYKRPNLTTMSSNVRESPTRRESVRCGSCRRTHGRRGAGHRSQQRLPGPGQPHVWKHALAQAGMARGCIEGEVR